jgi:thiol:disulfide interchange protein
MTLTRLLLPAALALLAASPVRAAGEVTWKVRLEPADVRAGEQARIVAEAAIKPEWHIYGTVPTPGGGPKPTSVALLEGSKLTAAGDVAAPPAHREFDVGFKKDVDYYAAAVALGLPVTVAADAAGAQQATVKVGWMACRKGACLPPEREEFTVAFTVAPGPARADRTAALTAAPDQPAGYEPPAAGAPRESPAATPLPAADGGTAGQIQDARNRGLLAFLGLAVLMGFAALLTPCVFPMVPITVSFFSKQQESGGSSLKAAGAYCLGIVFTFTGLGVLMAVLFGATSIQRLAANPYLNMALATLFIVLALNLFGVFEINLPSWLVDRAQSGSRKSGLLGPLLMGLTFTLTSFTCTFGFVGGLLAATTQGDLMWPILGMLAFSTAFASPFFLLALFPQYLAKMPKSGGWLVTVKAFMGFLELAAALKFLSNIDLQWRLGLLTQPVFLAIWSTLFLVCGCYLFGWLRLPHDAGTKPGPFRFAFAALSMAVGVWCLGALNGASLGKLTAFLPPRDYPFRDGRKAPGAPGGLTWLKNYEAALAQAKSENRPLFVDFTGITCTNCREMEETVFVRDEVAAELRKFVTVSLYTDLEDNPDSERYKQMQLDRFGTVELPLYVVLAPDETKIGQISYEPNAGKFRDFLTGAQQRFQQHVNRARSEGAASG